MSAIVRHAKEKRQNPMLHNDQELPCRTQPMSQSTTAANVQQQFHTSAHSSALVCSCLIQAPGQLAHVSSLKHFPGSCVGKHVPEVAHPTVFPELWSFEEHRKWATVGKHGKHVAASDMLSSWMLPRLALTFAAQ